MMLNEGSYSGVKLNIIDDEMLLAETIKAYGEYLGMDVNVFGNKSTFISHLNGAPELPDVVLCDLNLPDGNGLDICTHMRGRMLNVAMIMMSGDRNAELSVISMVNSTDKETNNYWLKKPFSLSALGDLFEQILTKK